MPWIASGDVLMLKDGQTITGKYEGGDQTSVQFLVGSILRQYPTSQINSITFTPTPAASTASRPSGSAPAPTMSGTTTNTSEMPVYSSGRSAPAGSTSPEERPTLRRSAPSEAAASAPAPAARPMGITVPAGAEITIRMIDPVDSAVNRIGETFRASIDEPLIVDGRTIAPRGADVTAKLTEVEEAGRISGRSELTLILMDITLNGRRYEITTSEVSQEGSSRGSQTAKRVGATAAIGAVLGGIFGGGKGAAQGAAAGAGAATAVQVLTRGEQVKIPSESRLVFTLSRPINL